MSDTAPASTAITPTRCECTCDRCAIAHGNRPAEKPAMDELDMTLAPIHNFYYPYLSSFFAFFSSNPRISTLVDIHIGLILRAFCLVLPLVLLWYYPRITIAIIGLGEVLEHTRFNRWE